MVAVEPDDRTGAANPSARPTRRRRRPRRLRRRWDRRRQRRGTAMRCARSAESPGARTDTRCSSTTEVDARFQYQLTDPGDCGPGGSCVLVVDDSDGERQALAVLVFGAPAPPPPTVTISPAELVEEGDQVRVDITGLQPHRRGANRLLRPRMHCARHGSWPTAPAEPATTVVVGAPCDRCGVAVIGSTHDTLTPVPFAPPRAARLRRTPARTRSRCSPPPCSPRPGASSPRSTGDRHRRPTRRTSTPPNSEPSAEASQSRPAHRPARRRTTRPLVVTLTTATLR